MKSKAIYFDVCTLCRPFDDQNYLRIRLETEAYHMILAKVKAGLFTMLVSKAHVKEIEAIPDLSERIDLQTILEKFGKPVSVNVAQTRKRADELIKAGFGIADAAHVAFSEKANAEFVSCDDALIKKCSKHGINTWCGNPILFCEKEGLK